MSADPLLATVLRIEALLIAHFERQRPPLTKVDRALLDRLLPVIDEIAGDTDWDVHTLLRIPVVLPAIVVAVGPHDSGMGKRLGRLLNRAEDRVILEQYCVQITGHGRNGLTYTIARIP